MSNIFLGLLGCHATLKSEEQRKGKVALAVFVIPDKDPLLWYYPQSRYTTEKFRGDVTTITNTHDMVNQLLQISQNAQAKIDFLSITGHGAATGVLGAPYGAFLIGTDVVTLPVLENAQHPVTA